MDDILNKKCRELIEIVKGYLTNQDTHNAIIVCDELINEAKKQEDLPTEALFDMWNQYVELLDYEFLTDEIIKQYNFMLDFIKRNKCHYEVYKIYEKISDTYLDDLEFDDAFKYINLSLKAFKDSKDYYKDYELKLLVKKAIILLENDKNEESIKVLLKADKIARELENAYEYKNDEYEGQVGWINYYLCINYVDLDEYEKCKEYGELAIYTLYDADDVDITDIYFMYGCIIHADICLNKLKDVKYWYNDFIHSCNDYEVYNLLFVETTLEIVDYYNDLQMFDDAILLINELREKIEENDIELNDFTHCDYAIQAGKTLFALHRYLDSKKVFMELRKFIENSDDEFLTEDDKEMFGGICDSYLDMLKTKTKLIPFV